jgi:hypothetical protein
MTTARERSVNTASKSGELPHERPADLSDDESLRLRDRKQARRGCEGTRKDLFMAQRKEFIKRPAIRTINRLRG